MGPSKFTGSGRPIWGRSGARELARRDWLLMFDWLLHPAARTVAKAYRSGKLREVVANELIRNVKFVGYLAERWRQR